MMSPKQKKAKRAAIVARDGLNCWYCGQHMTNPTLEHLIPKSQAGSNKIGNLVLAHQRCNNIAADKSLVEKVKMRDHFHDPDFDYLGE